MMKEGINGCVVFPQIFFLFSATESNRLMFVEEFCFIQLICLERKSHVYLDKVFPPYTPSSFFQLLYFTVCINVNPEMAGLSELLFSHTSTHCQIPPPKKLMLSLWQHFFSLGRNSNTVRRLTISSLWHLPT